MAAREAIAVLEGEEGKRCDCKEKKLEEKKSKGKKKKESPEDDEMELDEVEGGEGRSREDSLEAVVKSETKLEDEEDEDDEDEAGAEDEALRRRREEDDREDQGECETDLDLRLSTNPFSSLHSQSFLEGESGNTEDGYKYPLTISLNTLAQYIPLRKSQKILTLAIQNPKFVSRNHRFLFLSPD